MSALKHTEPAPDVESRVLAEIITRPFLRARAYRLGLDVDDFCDFHNRRVFQELCAMAQTLSEIRVVELADAIEARDGDLGRIRRGDVPAVDVAYLGMLMLATRYPDQPHLAADQLAADLRHLRAIAEERRL